MPVVQRRRPVVAIDNTVATPTPPVYHKTTFFSSGSSMLDLVLGGGWASGRIVNCVGDKSTGKTLLAVEACANVAALSGVEQVRYCEAEAAFDLDYGRVVGMPNGLTPVSGVETVEAVYEDLELFLTQVNPDYPSLYVLDSLDALSDAAEMEREIDKGSYGATKARKLSEMFRRIVNRVEKANTTLFIISQIRDKLNVTFGETKTRSGGRALDFYASQILWLAEVGKIKRSVMGSERVIGLEVRAHTKKNKLAPAFRECDLSVMFNFGVNDAMSMLSWMKKNKVEIRDRDKTLVSIMKKHDRSALIELEVDLFDDVKKHWDAIEAALHPGMTKYQT